MSALLSLIALRKFCFSLKKPLQTPGVTACFSPRFSAGLGLPRPSRLNMPATSAN